jgi:hypothetical protein
MEEKKTNILTEDMYTQETAMCNKLNSEKNGCLWGECSKCGVIPLLYKLRTGKLLHGEEVEKLKEDIFRKS